MWQVFHPPATELGYIRTAGGGNPAVLSPLSPLAVPLLLLPLLKAAHVTQLQPTERRPSCNKAGL